MNLLPDTSSILRCPISGADLHLANLEEPRARIFRGELTHAAGAPVTMQIEAALSSRDGRFIYPVTEGILVLLPGLAIVKPGTTPQFEVDLAGVMKFYDELGWHVTQGESFEDTVRFEDVREVSRRYVHESCTAPAVRT